MQLPHDLRAHALRTTIDAALTALRTGSGDKHVAQLLDDAR